MIFGFSLCFPSALNMQSGGDWHRIQYIGQSYKSWPNCVKLGMVVSTRYAGGDGSPKFEAHCFAAQGSAQVLL